MSNTYTAGTPVELVCSFRDKSNIPGDPTTVKLLIKSDTAPETCLLFGTDPDVTKVSVGSYRYEFTPSPGKWMYRWVGTGAAGTVRGAANGAFVVGPNVFSL